MPELPPSSLTLQLLGPFELRQNGQPLPRVRFRRGHWLLALLALRRGQEVERSWLAGTLWPDSSEPQALNSLRSSLTELRDALGPDAGCLCSPTPQTLSLDLSAMEVDVVAFDAAMARGDPGSLEEVVSLYRGPLLEGCAEEWAFQERQVREQAYLGALERLAAGALASRERAAAEQYLRQAITVDPLRESAQRGLMETLAAGGNYAAALTVYRELRTRLHRDVNMEPDPETRALVERIRTEARQKAARGSPLEGRSQDDGSSDARRPAGTSTASGEPRAASGSEATHCFLFTDIEGSTRLWEEDADAMRATLSQHDALLRQAIEAHGGWVFKTVGDQFCASFSTAPAALAAALAAQRGLTDAPSQLRVRMALHVGAAEERDGDYFGPTLNRVARLVAAGHGGQILVSLPTAEMLRDVLPEATRLRDLGEHRLKDLIRPERIFQVVSPNLPADFPPLVSLEILPNNLPRLLTSFIGREGEMAQVKERLGQAALLTLTGAGGCGKTRLALQVAADRVESYPDGVWLVEFAALADPGLVAQSVASALRVREVPGRVMIETLVEALQPKQLLLVLDNCEHLVGACASLVDTLLRTCPKLQILATSRQPLGVPGEVVWRVPSLSLPDPSRLPPVGADLVSALSQYEAVRLFIDRAVTSQPSFAVTSANAPAVAEVCHRLDGIPLAIELAAARVRVLSVEQLMSRLDDRFRVLTGGSRSVLPRQQTLRALIDWSYDLLSKTEQALLRRLSVFAGGWTLEAAESVCDGEGIEEWEVLDLQSQLVDKSLVLIDPGDEPRYGLLETIRQYGAAKLRESGEEGTFRRRHREWVLALTQKADVWFTEGKALLNQLETEHDNLRAALEWSLEAGAAPGGREEAETGLRLSGRLRGFWIQRGYLAEGREYMTRLLSLPEALECTRERMFALGTAGMIAEDQGDYVAARSFHEEGLTMSQAQGDTTFVAFFYFSLGCVARCQGDYAAARSLLEKSLALRGEEDRFGRMAALAWLGQIAYFESDDASAVVLAQECLAIAREIGVPACIGGALGVLGRVAQRRGDHAGAFEFFRESLAVLQQQEDKPQMANTLYYFALLAMAQGKTGRAVRLLGATEAARKALGFPIPDDRRAHHAEIVAAARAALGEEAFAAAWAAGQATSLEEAIRAALAEE